MKAGDGGMMEVAAEVWVKLTGSRLFKNRLANSRAILVRQDRLGFWT